MFTLYNKADLIQLFPLKFVRLQADFDIEPDTYILPNLGECHVYSLPIRFLEDNRTDTIIGFAPKDFYWLTNPIYFAFLSDMTKC